MHDVQYAERLPIGKESVIRNVPASTVKAFYQRWYRPEHMAVVVVGDFAVRETILPAYGDIVSPDEDLTVPNLFSARNSRTNIYQ